MCVSSTKAYFYSSSIEYIMLIREGKLKDAKAITDCLLLAMEEITYQFIGKEDADLAWEFLHTLVQQQGNQYSYNHTWVLEEEGVVLAATLIYDGGKLHELRKPVEKLIKEKYHTDFNPQDETQQGEYYIDCIAVKSNQQGRGLGTKILNHLIEEYIVKRAQVLGLLVDTDNPKARKLYERLGFQFIAEKSFMGKQMEHMQIKPTLI